MVTQAKDRRELSSWATRIALAAALLLVTAAVVMVMLHELGMGPQVPEEDRQNVTLAPALPPSAAAEGRLVLDLRADRVSLEPAPEGGSLSVQVEYDRSCYDLTEDFTQDANGRWTWQVRFGPSFQGARRVLVARRAPPDVRVLVPRSHRLALDARIGGGHSKLELGGLELSTVHLRLDAGEHAVGFGEAAPEPLEALSIRSSSGKTAVDRIGNASPASVSVQHELGQLSLDLSGSWQGGAELEVAVTKFGNIELLAPESVPLSIAGSETGSLGVVKLPEGFTSEPLGSPGSLRLSASARNGSVRVLR